MEDLRNRGIKALPVTIIDDKEIIIGYFPKKLVLAFNLDVKVDLSGKTEWLADKYERILSAACRATTQFSQEQLDTDVPWRPWTGRKTIMHIMSFPEVAYLSHQVGSMSQEDMRASDERLKDVYTAAEITEYGNKVRGDISPFLNSGNTQAFDQDVPTTYGGAAPVPALLAISSARSPAREELMVSIVGNPVAMMVMRTSSSICGSVTMPKKIFASGSTTSLMVSAAV